MVAELSLPMVARRPAEVPVPPGPGRPGVCLRPLGSGEIGPILDVFDGLSARSRWLRFLAPLRELSRPMLRALSDVDQDRHVAWSASVAGRTVGIARYVRLRDEPAVAEVAFAVVDDLHRRGIGSVLFEALAVVATHRGVAEFAFTVHPENAATLGFLRSVGAAGRYRDGLFEARLRLAQPAAHRFDARLLLRLADAAARSAAAA